MKNGSVVLFTIWHCHQQASLAPSIMRQLEPFALMATPFCPLPIATGINPNRDLLKKFSPENLWRVRKVASKMGREC